MAYRKRATEIVDLYEGERKHLRGYYSRTDLLAVADRVLGEAESSKAKEGHGEHLAHVQRFLMEMYQTMVDPVEEFHGNIEQLCALLLDRARQDREMLAGAAAEAKEGQTAPIVGAQRFWESSAQEAPPQCPTCKSEYREDRGTLNSDPLARCQNPWHEA
jgi:hypothetical protein